MPAARSRAKSSTRSAEIWPRPQNFRGGAVVRKRTSARRGKRSRKPTRKRLARLWPSAMAVALVGIVVLVVVFAAVGGKGRQSQPALTPVTESNGGSRAASSRTGGPAIYFPITEVDFGQVPLDTPASYAFEFANVGDDTLRVEDVEVKMLEGC